MGLNATTFFTNRRPIFAQPDPVRDNSANPKQKLFERLVGL
jgi:hypothetical protein